MKGNLFTHRIPPVLCLAALCVLAVGGCGGQVAKDTEVTPETLAQNQTAEPLPSTEVNEPAQPDPLDEMRQAIAAFNDEWNRPPTSLDELVKTEHLQEIPPLDFGFVYDYNPFTGNLYVHRPYRNPPKMPAQTRREIPAATTPSSSQFTDSAYPVLIKGRVNLPPVGDTLTITNNDSFDWNNVEMVINPNMLGSGYSLKVSCIPANTERQFNTRMFSKSDGTRFDPDQILRRKFALWCDTSRGKGSWHGKW